MAWKDVTGYSQRGDRTPRSWELKIGVLRLVVTRHVCYRPDEWLIQCEPFFGVVAENKELEDAKREAIDRLSAALLAELEAVQKARIP